MYWNDFCFDLWILFFSNLYWPLWISFSFTVLATYKSVTLCKIIDASRLQYGLWRWPLTSHNTNGVAGVSGTSLLQHRLPVTKLFVHQWESFWLTVSILSVTLNIACYMANCSGKGLVLWLHFHIWFYRFEMTLHFCGWFYEEAELRSYDVF